MPKRIRAHVNPLSITKEFSFEGFPNNNPIIIDVGSAKGEFAESLIQKFPEKNYILFEIREPLRIKLQEKFKDFPNVAVFGGDAGRNFERILAPSIKKGVKIETIYINFPDPWFKDRHKKRRFINKKFLDQAATYLPKTTELIFQTDQEFLFQETLEVLKDSKFSNIEFFKTSPFKIQTDWEIATKKLGRKIWRMKANRHGAVSLSCSIKHPR